MKKDKNRGKKYKDLLERPKTIYQYKSFLADILLFCVLASSMVQKNFIKLHQMTVLISYQLDLLFQILTQPRTTSLHIFLRLYRL